MKVGTEDKKKMTIAAVLGGLALMAAIYLYVTLFGGPSTPPPAPAVLVVSPATNSANPGKAVAAPAGNIVGKNAQKVGSANEALDPTLHMGPMLVTESLVYTGSGRNIFAAGSAPPPPVKVVEAKFPARPAPPVSQPMVPQGPAPPPRINLKFFGTATTANGNRRALLLNGDDVYLASVGDVVQRRYRVVSISANSVVVEDIPNSNKQNLPLMSN